MCFESICGAIRARHTRARDALGDPRFVRAITRTRDTKNHSLDSSLMPRGKRARGTRTRDDDADERLCWALERVVADPTIPDDVKGRVRAHCVKTVEAGRVEAYARGSSCARTGMCVLALSTSLREMDETEAACLLYTSPSPRD